MEAADQEINFRAVASEARVSTAWLYNRQELRGRIMHSRKSRTWTPSTESDRDRRDCLFRKSVVANVAIA